MKRGVLSEVEDLELTICASYLWEMALHVCLDVGMVRNTGE
jgi:hypothetical protein